MNSHNPLNLKPGDQIIATKSRRYPKNISPEGHFAQRPGQIIMVNNPNMGDLVGGTGLNGVNHYGRPLVGLGCSFQVGTFRRATPNDPGFMATREQWDSIKDAEIAQWRKLAVRQGVGLVVLALLHIASLARSLGH